jgi:DNA-binding response OmpR family regulator
MNQDDAVIESLLIELVDAERRSLRISELALEIFRRRKGEYGGRADTVPVDLIDDSRFTVCWSGRECHLGATVLFRLFRRLARPANKYVSIEHLLEDVWGDEPTEDATVRSSVRNLRRKLEDAGMAELARAIQGTSGHYRLLLDGVAPRH